MMKFLRFASGTQARAAFTPWLRSPADDLPPYIGTVAVDVVGVIQRPTGEMLDSTDGPVPVLAPVPGYHINLSERIPELQQYEIEPPAIPDRVFAGSENPAPPAWPRFFGNQKLDLFTQAEQLAVVTATMTDPVVKLLYDRLLGSACLTYEDAETEQGLAMLVDKGLLTTGRKAEIVAAMQPLDRQGVA